MKTGTTEMNADIDLQAWLETQNATRPEVIIPYVQSNHDTSVRYLLRTTVAHERGNSRISQGGVLSVPADTAVALPRLAVSSPNGECRIELVLTERMGVERRYEFDCLDARTASPH
ncbi:MAG TPA: curli-like amyloid fiber formation chaperone CsgH [Pusillimonas sp.]|uniref:curli-like amyloid fiber formation chaperone CsgH n=1 Tax=unclassified Pusillimonas TaxID=2640016 RepID=UPI0026282A49|nr:MULTISPECIES: curli-like amyloid fiber formation chaperone CsgH [unclassified Pusillimonas]HLU18738.1 curli-like amyloid fiber formation chaperone CsgH [Pusillimonas sp.]